MPRRNRTAFFHSFLFFFFILFFDGIVLVIIAIVTWRPVRTLPIRRRSRLDVSINLTTMLLLHHLVLELRTIVDILVVHR